LVIVGTMRRAVDDDDFRFCARNLGGKSVLFLCADDGLANTASLKMMVYLAWQTPA
jgi:hypothetical protein